MGDRTHLTRHCMRSEPERQHANTVAGAQPLSYVQLLRRNPSYRNLWFSQVVSNAGDWFSTIAVLALTLELTGSGLALSVTMLAQTLPAFLMAPLAGVAADRFDRKWVMISADLIRSLIAFGFLLVRRPEDVWLIFVCMALLSGFSPFFDAARNASLPSLCRGAELLGANALSSATWGLMLTVGSAIGGGVTALFGRDAAFILNGLSFLVSAFFVLRVVMPVAVGSVQGVHFFRDFVDGLAYIKRDRPTRAFLPVKATWALAGGSAVMLYALFGGQVFNRGDLGIAVLYTARGTGTLIGTVGMKWFPALSLAQLRRGIFIGLSGYGAAFLAFSFAPSLWIAALFITLSTCGSMVMWVFSSLGLQLIVDEGFRGRAFAADGGLFTLAFSISTLSAGLLLGVFDPRTVAFASGAIGIATACIWYILARFIPLPSGENHPR